MEFADMLSRLRAWRAQGFELVEELEAALGRDLDINELETRLDADFPGAGRMTEPEALAVLSSASPLRAVG